MMTCSKAIVLNTTKYGDSRIFVNAYSREYGMTAFSVSLAKGKRGNGRANCFQPLNMIEAEFDMKPHSDIFPLKDARIYCPASGIAFDPYKLSISMFLAEFLRSALRNEQRNYTLYDYIAQSIEWLDAAKEGFSNFHIVFMMKLARFIGFYPNMGSYTTGSLFNLRSGAFSALPEGDGATLNAAESAFLVTLDKLSFTSMHLLKMNRQQRNRCTEMMLEYYRCHLPSFPELRSFTILKELFI